MRYLADGRPLSPLNCWRQIAIMLGHWLLRGFGLWAVEERATGALVGRVGLLDSTGWPGFAQQGGWVLRQLRLLQWDGRAGDISTGTTRLVRQVAGERQLLYPTFCLLHSPS